MVFSLFITTNAFASMAVVNVDEIVKGSTAFKKLNTTLEKEKASYQDKIKQKEIELNAKRDDLQSKSSILSQENLQKQALEFQKEILSFQEDVKKKEANLQEKLAYGLNILNTEAQKIAADIVKESEGKYNTVINSTVLLTYSKDDDVTMEVLKRLNKKNLDLTKKDSKK